MLNAVSRLLWPFYAVGWQKRVTEDADRLMAELGAVAFTEAADRSWREDVGLITTNDPGHWSRVTLEVGRRMAITDSSPALPRVKTMH